MVATNTILFRNVSLPSDFFVSGQWQAIDTKPSANFSPCAALRGEQAWQSATMPAATPKPKTLIVTKQSFLGMAQLDIEIRLHWLTVLGFTIEIACNSSVDNAPVFERFEPNAVFTPSSPFTRTRSFVSEDYERLAQSKRIAKDAILVLNDIHVGLLMKCMEAQASLWHGVYTKFNDDDILSLEDKIQDGSQLASCLAVMQDDEKQWTLLNKNKDKIQDGHQLSSCLALIQDEAQRWTLLSEQKDKITNGNELNWCLPLIKDEERQWDFLEAHKDKISAKGELFSCIAFMKDEERKWTLIKDEKFTFASVILQFLPSVQDEEIKWQYINDHKDEITDGGTLARCLGVLRDEVRQGKLLAEHKDKITDGNTFAQCLGALRDEARQGQLLDAHEDKITDGYCLARCIGALRDEARQGQLLEAHEDKITDGGTLAQCLSALRDEARQWQLLEANVDKITDGGTLAQCLRALRDEARQWQLLEAHKDKFSDEYSLISCVWSLRNEERQWQLLEAHRDKVSGGYVLASCLGAIKNSEKRWMLLKANQDKIHNHHMLIRCLSSLSPWHSMLIFEAIPALLERDDAFDLLAAHPKRTMPAATVVHLYVSLDHELSFNTLISRLKSHDYPALAYVTVSGQDAQKIFELIDALRHCPMQLLRVSNRLHRAVPAAINFPVASIDDPLVLDVMTSKQSASPQSQSQLQSQPQSQPKPKQQDDALYVAQSGVSNRFNTKNRKMDYPFIKAGQRLNGNHLPKQRLRTGVFCPRNLAGGNFTQQLFFPNMEQLSLLAADSVMPAVLAHYRLAEVADGCYFQFTQQLTPGLNRLLSIDVDEALQGIVGEHWPDGVALFRCDVDGFYYVQANVAREISYVILAKTGRQQDEQYEAIPAAHPIRRIIDGYRDTAKGYQPSTPCDAIIPTLEEFSSMRAWLERMYDFRGGSCHHRVAAVEYKLTTEISANNIRVTYIDNSHTCLEVQHNNIWISINVGGGSGNQATFLPATYRYQQEPQESIKKKSRQPKTVKVKPESHLLPQLRALVAKENLVHRIADIDTLHTVLADENYRHIMLSVSHRQGFKCHCLQRAPESTFLIDTPENLQLLTNAIVIDANGSCQIDKAVPLARFFASISDQASPQPILVIDWSGFTAQQRIQLNTLLDNKRTLYGCAIPSNLRIISLFDALPNDDESLMSRHHYVGQITFTLKVPVLAQPSAAQLQYAFDVCGYADWQARLFGPIVLIDNKIAWQKSTLIKQLEALQGSACHVTLSHLPTETKQACQYYLAQASARGFFDYHGYRVNLPSNLTFSVDKADFCFKSFKTIHVYQHSTQAHVPQDIAIINDELFDYVLTTKSINAGVYQQSLGIIAAAQSSALSLWVSSNLSPSQWYCLLAEASKYQVVLSLYLAKGVQLPAGLSKQLEKNLRQAARVNLPRIIVTNDARHAETPHMLVIELDDMTYDSLVGYVDYTQSDAGFHNFSYKASDFVEALRGTKPIMLRGRCSASLLQALHPLLSGRSWRLPNGEMLTRQAPLTLRLEVDASKLPHSGKSYPPLACLGEQVVIEKHVVAQRHGATIIYAELPHVQGQVIDLSNTEQIAHDFMDGRKKAVINALAEHGMIQLVGSTGVGKSRLMKSIGAEDGITLYHDLAQLSVWAEDQNEQTKILFLDEANMLNQHFSVFIPLKHAKGVTCEIYYQGRCYTLSAQHKVVFAKNPMHYSMGRYEQRLLHDPAVPELHFVDFPPAVLYEMVLKPLNAMGGSIASRQEESFKVNAVQWLEDYYNQCAVANNDYDMPTARELQHRALRYIMQQCREKRRTDFFNRRPQGSVDYVGLPSMAASLQQMHQFIHLHTLQQDKRMSAGGMGLNGCYIAGPPGIGKSVSVIHMLTRNGFQAKTDPNSSCLRSYDKLDACLMLAEKKARIIHAFDNGQTIVIDEINSCADDGLEAVLNSVLTGMHPVTGKSATKPGFMVFFTANSIALSGRAALSPALMHRCETVRFAPLTVSDIHWLLLAQKRVNAEVVSVQTLAEDVVQLMQADPSLSLRFLLPRMDKFASIYKEPPQREASLKPNKSCYIRPANHC